jgi:hypothetical protein
MVFVRLKNMNEFIVNLLGDFITQNEIKILTEISKSIAHQIKKMKFKQEFKINKRTKHIWLKLMPKIQNIRWNFSPNDIMMSNLLFNLSPFQSLIKLDLWSPLWNPINVFDANLPNLRYLRCDMALTSIQMLVNKCPKLEVLHIFTFEAFQKTIIAHITALVCIKIFANFEKNFEVFNVKCKKYSDESRQRTFSCRHVLM